MIKFGKRIRSILPKPSRKAPSFSYGDIRLSQKKLKSIVLFNQLLYSSRILRDEFAFLKSRLPTLWTNSCFISSVGGAPLEVIKQYIENQQISERPKQKQKWKNYVANIQI